MLKFPFLNFWISYQEGLGFQKHRLKWNRNNLCTLIFNTRVISIHVNLSFKVRQTVIFAFCFHKLTLWLWTKLFKISIPQCPYLQMETSKDSGYIKQVRWFNIMINTVTYIILSIVIGFQKKHSFQKSRDSFILSL